MPKARAAALKALEIDNTLAEPHAALGFVGFNYDWDWRETEKQFKQAIALNPSYATAHHWYSHYSVAIGQFEESLAASRRALELDPLDLIINAHLAWHYDYARQYDRAIEQCRKVLEMDPKYFWPHFFLGLAYEQEQMYQQATAEFQKAITVSSATFALGGLGHTYAVSGKRGEALRVLGELKERSKRGYVPAFDIALIYAGLGEKDQAFEWLEKAYGEHSGGLAYLRVEPRLDNVRSDPRFADLLRRIGIPP